jgi:hypothetical protein
MKFSRFHRCTACILTVLFLMSALLLVGCGQSNQGNPSDTTASTPRETSPIVNATRVEKGMSYAEVHALLGFDGTKIGFQTNLYTWYLEGNKRLLVWFTLPEGETGNSTDRMTVLDYTIEPLS